MTRLATRIIAAAALLAATSGAGATTVDHLAPFAFGTVTNLTIDQTQTQSACTGSLLGTSYSVTATGSAAGGAFAMAGGGTVLAYDVQWAASAGQTSGTQLSPGVPLGGLPSGLLSCVLGLTNDASLIVVLRATALGAATAASYSGTLQILLSPN